ncbi:MAG: flippase [Chloroflexi bacterium]|nr:flippase [Chloroflexota bacterium]
MKRSDRLVLPVFFLLAIAYLWPVTLGGRTLVPADNLFAFPPWSAYAAQVGVTVPHNDLLSDLLLENYAWKQFIVNTVRQGELPLWNPNLFTGLPFLAAGQQSALYPFFALFFVMPVELAFGWFVALQLGIAGAAMYLFARAHRLDTVPALIAALAYQFSAFLLVSVVFPMVISAACWLPLLLLVVEKLVVAQYHGARGGVVAGWIAAGALLLGVSYLAGHVEVSYYNLLVMAFYGAWRGLASGANAGAWRARAAWLLRAGLPLIALVALGTALAALQIVPLFELVSHSAREGSQPYTTIAGYAYPVRQIATFFIPDFYGNPSHHGFVDWWTREVQPFTQDANGQPASTVFWGIKNYVEAGAYIGILPLLLALIAVAARLHNRKPDAPYLAPVLPLAVLAALSLAFVFGTPLYALLFYTLPGFSQLHSPFRWVYPFTLSVALLAGVGAQWLLDRQRVHRLWGWLPFGAGGALLLVLGASQFVPGPFLAVAERVLRGSDLAQRAYPDARAFFSYEAINLLKLALLLMASGGIVLLARRATRGWPLAAAALVVADLFIAGNGFYTAADPALLKFTPPAVQFLQQDKSLFRIATLDKPGEKVFNANVGMFYGLQDIRGYDSIIPKQYYDWISLVETQGELIYNRIAPFYWRGSLESALVDLANVKYVLTTQDLSGLPKFTRVYTGELNIYQNEQVMPRAFVIPSTNSYRLQSLDQLKSLDPRLNILLPFEGRAENLGWGSCSPLPAPEIRKYTATEVVIDVYVTCSEWLVLSDANFDGWQVFVSSEYNSELERSIVTANGNFRAVELAPGPNWQTVRFRYNPLSFRLGGAISFFALMALLLTSGYALWSLRKPVAHAEHDRSASRVLKNSAFPMLAQLLNKGIDTVFTLYMLRVLGVENAGKLAAATLIIGYCDIVVNFGLSTLVTRDVSRERGLANRYLSNTGIMRFMLIAALVPLLAAYLWASGQSADTALAIWLLFIGLVPSSMAASLSAIFYASEQMEYPAVVTVITTLMKVTVGTLVLLAGYGFVGLAGANIATNVATLAILLAIFARRQFVPRPEFSAQFSGDLVRSSYPLMLNDMLSRLFNRVDVLILQQMKGNVPVGMYSTTYKYLEGINILPSTFTIALFPVLSRYAAGAPDALMRAYLKSLKYLLVIAMPIMVFSFAWSDFIMFVFGGEKFLPDSAIALRLIIGFLPFSFINNITHYVLIAVNQQKFLTWTFVIGAIFNIGANLLLIPIFSYQASAVITIGSELVLLALFYRGVRNHVGHVNWLDVLWRPALGAAAMGGVLAGWGAMWGLGDWAFLGAMPLALLEYAAVLLGTRTFSAEDRDTLRLLLPARFRRKAPAA